MSVQLEINRSTERYVRKCLEENNLLVPHFLSWKQALEFILADDPSAHMSFARKGGSAFHECQTEESVRVRRFLVNWEIEWDRDAGRFHLLEIAIFKLQPKLLADP